MKKKPLVSILIANYNNGKYINECIQSINNQSYDNIEILIRDDCSTDDSLTIISNIMDNYDNIKLYRNDINRKVAYTKRKLIEDSLGQFCAIVDPDDTIHPNAISILIKKHEEIKEAAIVYSTHYLCNEELEIVKLSNYPKAIPEGENHMTCPGISALALFRKKNYLMTEGILDHFFCAEDQDLYYKLEETGDTVYVDIPLYYYRRYEGAVSSNVSKSFKQYHIRSIKSAIKRRVENNSKLKVLSKWELSVLSKRYEFTSKFDRLKGGYYFLLLNNLYKQRKAVLSEFKATITKYKI